MTDTIPSLIPLAIPILDAERREAYEVSTQFPREQEEQHYRSVLVAVVMRRCLTLLGIDYSEDIIQNWSEPKLDFYQQVNQLACLYIPEVQKHLWCYPIHPGDRQCFLPKGDDKSLGIVVIELDNPYRVGQVLGFAPVGSGSALSVSALQPLDALIDCIVAPQRSPIRLSQWLDHLFESDWQPLDTLLQSLRQPILNFASALPRRGSINPETIQQWVNQLYLQQSANTQSAPANLEPPTALAQLIQTTQDDEIRWQAAELLWELDPQHPACPVISSKDLGLYLAGEAIALMVGILSKSDGKMLILLRAYPLKQPHLPEELKLIVLDETGNTLQELESRQRDDYMQFKITADVGDRFSVRVVFNEASFTESFVV
ncbi:DUF1822 family protein [Allocoleopsis sp.]|uniref:DUF1822 family protein n=1 Tax=Allocoleopsis sp. TaxID=3088169 RepID=UPI002FD3856A